MKSFLKICLFLTCISPKIFALESEDKNSIEQVVKDYTYAWNFQAGRGFADNFSEDADFVNIFGMAFSGKKEIEERHILILDTFLKGSVFEVTGLKLREISQDMVVALVYWKLDGFRERGSDLNAPGEIRYGIFSHTFVKNDDDWEITVCQNTLMPKR